MIFIFQSSCTSIVIRYISLQYFCYIRQLSQIEFPHHQQVALLLIADHHQSFNSSKSLQNSRLKSLVLFVYLSELFFSIVLYNVTHINKSCFKESLALLWIGMITYFHLLALNFHLFNFRVFYFHFGRRFSDWYLSLLVLDAKSCIFLSSHLFHKVLFVGFVLSLLNSI